MSPPRRHTIIVDEVGPVAKVSGAHVRIITVDVYFDLYVAEDLIATCSSAKRLADWAWAHGAETVRYDYDLALSEDEL